MKKESRDYLEMSFHSINCFANDGVLKVKELDEILSIALRDGRVDDNEKRVLRSIIGRLKAHELDSAMLAKVDQVKRYLD